MKLDPTVMRTMERTDFRVLQAVETSMKDHQIVPVALIHANAGLRHGGSHKIISSLLRDKLLSHERKGGMDGYRVTQAGYDILALHNLKSRGFIAALGQRIGTGKESDIYLAATPKGRQVVLKFHRLGRTSFRNVRQKRDYFNNNKKAMLNQAHSWLFLSRLSALKEFSFMKALYDVKYPTPTPIAHNRHVIAMSLVRGVPLFQLLPKQVSTVQSADIYQQSIAIAARLAKVHGLVHCDLNEFNLLVDLSGIQSIVTDDANDPYVRHSGQSVVTRNQELVGMLSKPAWEQSLQEQYETPSADGPTTTTLPEPAERLSNGDPKPVVTLIDFPQMISTLHPNAQEYYERDITCLRKFFEQKLQCELLPDKDDDVTSWESVMYTSSSLNATTNDNRLDLNLQASGFSPDDHQHLELYYFESGPRPIGSELVVEEEEEEEEEYDEYEKDEEEQEDDTDDRQQQPTHEITATDKNDAAWEASSQLSNLSHQSLRSLSKEQLQEIAKSRVRRQLTEQRRKNRQAGAFRKPNSNKKYEKGRRIVSDSLL